MGALGWQQILRPWILLMLVGAIMTGVVLLMQYRVDEAHASTQRILEHPIFSVILKLHHWASAALILLSAVYLLLYLLSGAFRRPTHARWYGALALFMLVMLLQLTGHALPWDQRAFWTVAIETAIAGGIPLIGDGLMIALRAGESVTDATLSLWYRWHVYFLSVAMAAWLVWSVRLGWWRDWSSSAIRWSPALLAAWVACGLWLPVPFGAEADPQTNYSARPEWYVLPLHASLNTAQKLDPKAGWIGSALIPGILIALLVWLPFLFKSRADEARSPWLSLGAITSSTAALVFTLTAAQNVASPIREPEQKSASAGYPVIPIDEQKAALGARLIQERRCLKCHIVNGEGKDKGPELTHVGKKHPSAQWHMEHLKDPEKFFPGTTMPTYDDLPPEQLEALAHYLASLK